MAQALCSQHCVLLYMLLLPLLQVTAQIGLVCCGNLFSCLFFLCYCFAFLSFSLWNMAELMLFFFFCKWPCCLFFVYRCKYTSKTGCQSVFAIAFLAFAILFLLSQFPPLRYLLLIIFGPRQTLIGFALPALAYFLPLCCFVRLILHLELNHYKRGNKSVFFASC